MLGIILYPKVKGRLMKKLNTINSRVKSQFKPLCFALLGLFYSGHSLADETKKTTSNHWVLGIGAGYFPKFSGSEDYEVRALPVIKIQYGNFSFGGIGGISYRFINNKGFTSGISVGYFQGRDESDADYLQGLGDLSKSATVGLYAKKQFGGFSISANVTRDFSDEVSGITSDISAGYAYKINQYLMVNTSVKARLMNDRYAQAVYGVTQAQSMASGLTATTAEAGIESASLSITTLYFINKQWTASIIVSASQLLGDAKESPITRESQPKMFMTSIAYRF